MFIKSGADKSCFAPFKLVLHAAANPQPQPSYQPPQPSYSGAKAVTSHCAFRLDIPAKLNGFKMGGDDGGNVDAYPDRLEIFKKSAGVAIAFGAIDSAIEGKGKLFFTLRPDMMTQFQRVTNKKGRVAYYLFNLTDGRALRLQLTGKQEAAPAIEQLFGRQKQHI